MKASSEYILDAGEIRLLERLRLNPRKLVSGRIRGDRLTRKKGVSIEFADFRDYADGDDVRHLDWNVLARMQTPVIRTYRDEEDVAVYVMIDCSASMSFGQPTKLHAAKKIAASIGYIALCGSDALYPLALAGDALNPRALRGRTSFLKFDTWLASQNAVGETSLTRSLMAFSAGRSRPGFAIVISDGLDSSVESAIAQLGGRGHEVGFIQVLSPEEIDPDIEGDLRLIDSESRDTVEITANSQALRKYKDALNAHYSAVTAACKRIGGRYAQVSTRQPIESVVKDVFRRQGWVI
jgi:uncharacterized protein (DUF58 family)